MITILKNGKLFWAVNKTVILVSVISGCLSFLFSCNEQESLDGHWHYYHHLEVDNQMGKYLPKKENHYRTFDIEEETLKTLNLLGLDFEETIWEVDKNEKRIYPHSHELSIINYSLSGDTLFWRGKNENFEGFALKVDKNKCNFQKDFFADSKMDIELPIIEEDSLVETQNIRDYLCLEILIGRKKGYESKLGKESTYFIQAVNHLGKIEDLPKFIENEKSKMDETWTDSLEVLLLIDKKTSQKIIEKIRNQLVVSNIKKAYSIVIIDTSHHFLRFGKILFNLQKK